MIGKYGDCNGCGKFQFLTKPALKLCAWCNDKRLKAEGKSKIQKRTGEYRLFEEIWQERPHVSEVSGDPLGPFSVWFFAHVLSKGSYPSLRLRKDNIILLTKVEHLAFDRTPGLLKEDPAWAWVFERKAALVREFYNSNCN